MLILYRPGVGLGVAKLIAMYTCDMLMNLKRHRNHQPTVWFCWVTNYIESLFQKCRGLWDLFTVVTVLIYNDTAF